MSAAWPLGPRSALRLLLWMAVLPGSFASPASPAWAAGAETSTAAAFEPSARRTVENRAFRKAERFHLRLGGAYLGREDFWHSPGLTAELGYQIIEVFGVDLSSTVFFSTLDAAARQIRIEQGLLPDAQQPILRVVLGPRWSFAYGKILLEGTDLVLHLDASLLLRLGTMITDRSANFGGDVALAFQVGLGERWLAWAEVAGWVGFEDRESSNLSGGPMGSLGLGVQL